jgi:hypothetical protein
VRIDELQLDELTGYRGNSIYQVFQQSENMNDFLERLSTGGFDVKELGQGFFGAVFSKPGSKDVYKVFTEKDKGYLQYLQYVKQNQNNPHVPRIHGGLMRVQMPLNRHSFQSKGWIIVRMEQLSDMGPSFPDQGVMNMYIRSHPSFNSASISAARKLDVMTPPEMARFERKYPELAEVLAWVAANGNRNGIKIDLHGDNFMFRGDTVVITDPFSYFG